ncbi:MAG: universal stress protein [Burkholderiales bacterium]
MLFGTRQGQPHRARERHDARLYSSLLRLLPASSRAFIRRQVKAFAEERTGLAQAALAAGVARLRDCGWTAKGELRVGAPLKRLLSAARDHDADVLVLGARAVNGLERLLLGSVR